MEIKLLAKTLGLERCEVNTRAITCKFAVGASPAADGVPDLIHQYGDTVRFPTPQTIEILISAKEWAHMFHQLRGCLNILIGSTNSEKVLAAAH